MILQKMLILRGLSLLLLFGSFSIMVQGQCIEGAIQTNGGHAVYGGPDCPDCGGSGTFTVLKLCDTHPNSISLCGIGKIPVQLENFCTSAQAPISVYTVNLVDLDENQPIGTEVEWPIDQYRPIHLRYEFDDLQSLTPTFIKYSEPIQKWVYFDDITVRSETREGGEDQTFKLFKGVASVDIVPLERLECGSGQPYTVSGMDVDVVYNIPANEVTDWADYNIRFPEELMDLPLPANDPTDGYVFYPISEYGGNSEIFSSSVFTGNCDNCPVAPNCPSCSGPPVASDQLDFCVECPNCFSEPQTEGSEDDNENFRLQANASSSDLSPLSISPNPFSTYTQYQYFSKEETNIQVNLFSTDGVALLQEVQKVGIGENTYRLDTQAIPEGAYYLQVKTNTENYMKLIVKIE